MNERQPRELVVSIPRPSSQDPERLRAIAKTHVFANDSRTLVIKTDVRKLPWRWNSDRLRKYRDDEEMAQGIVGLIAFQLSQSRRAFVIIPSS